MKNTCRLLLMVTAAVAAIVGGGQTAEAVTMTLVKSATPTYSATGTCPSGYTYDSVTKSCKPIATTGSSTGTVKSEEITLTWNSLSGQWDLIYTLELTQVDTATTNTYQYVLYSFTGPAPEENSAPPLLPFTYEPPQLQLVDFGLYEPATISYGTPLWNRDPYEFSVSYINPVPEPSTFVLFGAGLAGLGGLAIRRRIKSRRE